jgi:hypothetical protein
MRKSGKPRLACARTSGTQGPHDTLSAGAISAQAIAPLWRFASLALGPGSRSARARALAALARDTRVSCPGRVLAREDPGPRGDIMNALRESCAGSAQVGSTLICAHRWRFRLAIAGRMAHNSRPAPIFGIGGRETGRAPVEGGAHVHWQQISRLRASLPSVGRERSDRRAAQAVPDSCQRLDTVRAGA